MTNLSHSFSQHFPNSQASPQHRAPWSLHVWGVRAQLANDASASSHGHGTGPPLHNPRRDLGWWRALNQSCVGMYYTYIIVPRVCDSLFFSVSPVFVGFRHWMSQSRTMSSHTMHVDVFQWFKKTWPVMKLYDLTPGTDLHKNIQDLSRIQKRPKFSIWQIHPFVQATSHHGRSRLLGDGEGDSLPQVLRRWAGGWSTWWWAQPQSWGVCYTKV